jgi:hypothetical protein
MFGNCCVIPAWLLSWAARPRIANAANTSFRAQNAAALSNVICCSGWECIPGNVPIAAREFCVTSGRWVISIPMQFDADDIVAEGDPSRSEVSHTSLRNGSLGRRNPRWIAGGCSLVFQMGISQSKARGRDPAAFLVAARPRLRLEFCTFEGVPSWATSSSRLDLIQPSCCNAATPMAWRTRQVFAPITPSSFSSSTRRKHIRILCHLLQASYGASARLLSSAFASYSAASADPSTASLSSRGACHRRSTLSV